MVARVASFLIGASETFPEAKEWASDLLQPWHLRDGLATLMFGSDAIPAPAKDRMDRLLAVLIPKISEREILQYVHSFIHESGEFPKAHVAVLRKRSRVFDRRRRKLSKRYSSANLGQALNHLGAALDDAARYDDALGSLQESVAIYRSLAQQQQSRYQAELANTLRDLGVGLDYVARHEDAIAPLREAIAIYRTLTEQESSDYRSNLAEALAVLGGELSELGQYDEAVTVVREAVTIYRSLAQQHRADQLGGLANALSNLGTALREGRLSRRRCGCRGGGSRDVPDVGRKRIDSLPG